MSHTLDLKTAASGLHTLELSSVTPEGEYGLLAELALQPPPSDTIVHYAAYQRHDPGRQVRTDQAIGGGANRVQGLCISRWSEAIEGGVFAVLELTDGEWLTLLPVAGPESFAWLAPDGEGVSLRVGTLGTAPVSGNLPVLAWSRSENVYLACEQVSHLALHHPMLRNQARMRPEKDYPEIFHYLGWCSWEQHKREISSGILVDAARRINAGDLPVRFLLVDDGYHCHSESGKMMGDQLVRFRPSPGSFPAGWRPLLQQRRADGLRWFGLWQNFSGYWGRIAVENELIVCSPEAGEMTVWRDGTLHVSALAQGVNRLSVPDDPA